MPRGDSIASSRSDSYRAGLNRPPLVLALLLMFSLGSPLPALAQKAAKPDAPVLIDEDKDGLPGASVGPSRAEIEDLIRTIGRDPVSPELVDRIDSVFRPRWASYRNFEEIRARTADKAFVAKLDKVSHELSKKPADTRSVLFRSVNHTPEATIEEVREAMRSDLEREGGTWKTLKGRVLNDEVGGKPIAGAVVSSISGTQTRTDARGNFTLKTRPPSGTLVINVEAPDHALTQYYYKWTDVEDVQAEVFRVPRSVPFGGRVVGPEGKPIAGAELALWMGLEAICRDGSGAKVGWGNGNVMVMKARTDGDGKYAFRGIPPELDGRQAATTFTVSHPKYLGRTKQYTPNEWLGSGWEITLEPGCVLTGTVVDEEGKPVAQATVHTTFNTGDFVGIRPTSTTDAEGRFRFENLPAALVNLSIDPKAHLLTHASATSKQGEVVEVKIKVDKGMFITGKVIGTDGKPATNAQVGWLVSVVQPRLRLGRSNEPVTPSDDGTFRVGPVAKGRYKVTGLVASPRAIATVEAEAGGDPIVIELKADQNAEVIPPDNFDNGFHR